MYICVIEHFLAATRKHLLHEKCKAKGRKVCFGFVDLEKASDRVARAEICWAMRN